MPTEKVAANPAGQASNGKNSAFGLQISDLDAEQKNELGMHGGVGENACQKATPPRPAYRKAM